MHCSHCNQLKKVKASRVKKVMQKMAVRVKAKNTNLFVPSVRSEGLRFSSASRGSHNSSTSGCKAPISVSDALPMPGVLENMSMLRPMAKLQSSIPHLG